MRSRAAMMIALRFRCAYTIGRRESSLSVSTAIPGKSVLNRRGTACRAPTVEHASFLLYRACYLAYNESQLIPD